MKIKNSVYSIVLILLSSYSAFSQTIFINVKAPASPIFSSADVWNFDVINSTGPEFKARFEATISNLKNGALVELSSNPVTVPRGIGSFSPSTIQTKSVKYINTALADLERSNHTLPGGNYSICIRMICIDEVCETLNREGGSYCTEASVIESSPLLLNTPTDLSVIQETTPVLTWIPPMPSGSSPDMTYTISLYKIRENQSAQDAVSRNRALFKQDGLKDIALLYPTGVDQLEIGKKYAWYAEAWLGKIHVATSEVWQFEIAKEKKKKEPEFINYVKVNDNLTTVHSVNDYLRYSYIEEYNGKHIKVSILDVNKNYRIYNSSKEVKYGENTFSENISDIDLTSGNLYKLFVTNDNNQTFELLFTVK